MMGLRAMIRFERHENHSASGVFKHLSMTIAWYGHLKYRKAPLLAANRP